MYKIGKVNGKYVVMGDRLVTKLDRRGRIEAENTVHSVKKFDTLVEAVKSTNFDYELLSGSYLWSDDYYEPIDFKKEYKPNTSLSFMNKYVR